MPVTVGLVSAGIQGLGGLAQMFGSGRDQKQSDLEKLAKSSPLYTPSKSINDYYQQALNRYQENPYQSPQYIAAQQAAQRATASGISALQDRRSALGGIGRLDLIQNNAMQNAGLQAVAQQNQRFGQLGQASQLQAGEQAKAFDINQMTPYNRQLQLKQYAAQAANERYNAGMQMLGGAAANAAQLGSSYLSANPKMPPPVDNSSYYPTWYSPGTKGQQTYMPTNRNIGYGDYTNATLSNNLPNWAINR